MLNQIITGDAKELLSSGQFIITDHAIESFRVRIKKVEKGHARQLIEWAILRAANQPTFKPIQKLEKDNWTARVHVEELDFIIALRLNPEGFKLNVTTIWESPFSNSGRLSSILHHRVDVKEMATLIDDYERKILRLEDEINQLANQVKQL